MVLFSQEVVQMSRLAWEALECQWCGKVHDKLEEAIHHGVDGSCFERFIARLPQSERERQERIAKRNAKRFQA